MAGVIIYMVFVQKVPGSIAAPLLGTPVVAAFGIQVETIGTRFGGIPSGQPANVVPQFQPDTMLASLSPALTVALLGTVQGMGMSWIGAGDFDGGGSDINDIGGGSGTFGGTVYIVGTTVSRGVEGIWFDITVDP